MSAYYYGGSNCKAPVAYNTGTALSATLPVAPVSSTTICGGSVQVSNVQSTTNRLGTIQSATISATPAPAPPQHTVSYISSGSCGGSNTAGYGSSSLLGASNGSGCGSGSGVLTVPKGIGGCSGLLGGTSGGGCGTPTLPGKAALIGGYQGNPGLTYCTLNTNEFCNFRISSGTYSSLVANGYNTTLSTQYGFQILNSNQYTCSNVYSNQIVFTNHWMQIGSVFKLSGVIGMVITQTPLQSGITGVTGTYGNVPNPQILINLPVSTNISTCATLTGMAFAYVIDYPFGLPFNTIAPGTLVAEYPIFSFIRYGCTSNGDYAGIVLGVGAPLGLNGGSTPTNPNGVIPSGVTPTLVIQFELTIDLAN